MAASQDLSSDLSDTSAQAEEVNHTSLAGETATPPAGQAEPPKNRIPEIPVSEVRHVKTQEELDEVLAAHSLWVEQVLDPDVEVARGRANLSGVDLRGLSLREANLSGANLAQANLAEVDLTSANLSAANLVGAVLACANLSGAKLRGAKLDGADLRGADLTGAHLQGVDLSRCIMKSPETPTAKTESTAESTAHSETVSESEPKREQAACADQESAASSAPETMESDPQDREVSETPESLPVSPLFGEQISYIVP